MNAIKSIEQESLDTFFLKAKDDNLLKQKEFEKQSLDNDFMIV